MRKYFYSKLREYLDLYIRANDRVAEIDARGAQEQLKFAQHLILPAASLNGTGRGFEAIMAFRPDYVLLNGNVHFEHDIQVFLQDLRSALARSTRVIITFYNNLWRPLLRLATAFGWRSETPEQNWIAPEDMRNLLLLAGYELVREEAKVLLPVYVPLLSYVANRFLAPLPGFRLFSLVNIVVARPVDYPADERVSIPSVSIIVPARNEAGNIEAIIRRTPAMGPDDELIFIEGDSTDETWETICRMKERYGKARTIRIDRQQGKGKGDAVRQGFSHARKDILMILDADLTVPPEELPRFYDALVSQKGEFINGSRLVYPMEKRAMRFFNLLGNKLFAVMFSFILGQRFKDTLCGTKVLSRENYLKLASHRQYFGEFDPFGDFDLIFGAARMALRIIEVPVHYRERTYGETNIKRWRHGILLLQMLKFAAARIKFM